MMRIALVLAILTLAACGADGEPIAVSVTVKGKVDTGLSGSL